MKLHRRFLFNLTKAKLVFVRIISSFIVNKQKRRNFRNKLYLKYKKQYLKQYLYALNNKKEENSKIQKQKNKIWVCWLQGEENAPEVVKTCIKSIRKYKPENMNIIILNNENIKDYADIPEYIYKKKEKGQITNTQFSDLLRIALLSKHGGMWIDSTVLLTAPIPEDILKAEFFAFHSEEKGKHNNSWFLVSRPNHILVESIKNLMFEYWKNENKMLDYFQYHLFFDLMLENNKQLEQEWQKIPVYWDHDCYDFGMVFFKKYNKEEFEKFSKHFMHKLTYKYNKNADIKGTFLEKILSL